MNIQDTIGFKRVYRKITDNTSKLLLKYDGVKTESRNAEIEFLKNHKKNAPHKDSLSLLDKLLSI